MTDREHVYDQRTHTTRGLVAAVDDTGAAQTVTVQTQDGVTRTQAEVHLPFGFAHNPPANGGVVVMIANGGDHSDMIALPAACPLGRFGNLAPGETAIYAADGTRIHLKIGGIVEILAAQQVLITAPDVLVMASGGVTLTGNVSIAGTTTLTGDLHVSGSITSGGNISAAGHVSGN